MRRLELAIEQREPADAHPGDEVGERNLRRVRAPTDHRFTKDRATERDRIEPADKLSILPGFNRMGIAVGMKHGDGALDLDVDPRIGAIGRRFGAQLDDRVEGHVGRGGEPPGKQRLLQAARKAEAVEWQDRAGLGFHPINRLRIATVGHGKDTDRVSAEKQIRI